MRTTKALVSVFLSCGMILGSMVGSTVYADNGDAAASGTTASDSAQQDMVGVILPTPEEYEQYLQNLSPEMKAEMNAKIAAAEALANQPQARSATKISIPGTFTMYKQLEETYCVPACVQSVLQYETGTVLDQYEIAGNLGTALGTSMSNVAPYLDAKQNFCYVFTDDSSKSLPVSTVLSYLHSTISNARPCLMSVNITQATHGWQYVAASHCVVINAIFSDNSQVQIADPAGQTQWASSADVFYIVDATGVNNACTGIIW